MRVGTPTELSRKWGPQGHRLLARVHIGYSFVHLFVALAPSTGQIFAMFLLTLNQACFQLFAQQMDQTRQQPTLLVADRATAHKASLLTDTQLILAHLPTACLELNPVERFFKDLRRQMACRVFGTLQAAQDCAESVLKTYFEQPKKVCQ